MFAEGNSLLASTSFVVTNSFFLKNENNSFPITTPDHWTRKSVEETINKISNFLELGCQNDIELHVKENEKKCVMIAREFSSSHLDSFKSEKIEELKNMNYTDHENMVYTHRKNL